MLWNRQDSEQAQVDGDVDISAPEATEINIDGADAGEGADAAGEGTAFEAIGDVDFSDGVSGDEMMALWSSVGWPIVKALILIIVVLIVAGWVGGLVTRICRKGKVDETLAKFFGNMAKYTILVLGGLAVLNTFGIDTTSFAAVIAAAGFAIGLALSGLLGNFAAGVLLLFFRPFKVGDVISAAGITAKVDSIELFTTIFTTPDNRKIIVPNSDIFDGTIENVTIHDTRRVDVSVGTEYSADLDQTREVLMGASKKIEGGLGDPEPVVYLNELGDSSISWAVRLWAKTPDYWAVKERLTRQIKYDLDEAGIGIPFPQMDVHLDGKVSQGA